MEELLRVLQAMAPLDEAAQAAFVAVLEPVHLASKDVWLQAGLVCQHSAYVVSGSLRHVLIEETGNERILEFSLEGAFVSNCESYGQQTPSHYRIEALEPTQLLVFRTAAIEQLCRKFPVFETIGRLVTNRILAAYRQHVLLLLMQNPADRYEYMLTHQPRVLQRVSVTHLAQFLGVARETMSRLRNKAAA